jgi:hypothetical protein
VLEICDLLILQQKSNFRSLLPHTNLCYSATLVPSIHEIKSMIEIPSDWRIVWNNLALPETEMTAIESLFCAVYQTIVISMDYSSYKNQPCYSFSLQIGKSPEIAFESITQLTCPQVLATTKTPRLSLPKNADI